MSDSSLPESFITRNGNLKVQIDAEYVNWFDFLWFSRITNSKSGGWRNKTYWWKWGVEVLTSSEASNFLPKWTTNSLASTGSSLPRPRTENFKLDRADSDSRRELRRNSLELSAASENDLSYALYKGGLGKLSPLEGINVLSYEVPLSQESEGQLKVDLFGLSAKADAIEIVEIKKAANQSDSPLLALTEAICYALQTLRCYKYLTRKGEALEFHRSAFQRINLTILAPPDYWKTWIDEAQEIGREHIQMSLQRVIDAVNVGIAQASLNSELAALKPRLTLSPLRDIELLAQPGPASSTSVPRA